MKCTVIIRIELCVVTIGALTDYDRSPNPAAGKPMGCKHDRGHTVHYIDFENESSCIRSIPTTAV